MAKKLSHRESVQRSKYAGRVEKVAKFHKFGFDASKLAKSGKLTGAQKSAITRQYESTRSIRKQIDSRRAVFVPVKSGYRRSRSLETGTAAGKTNRGVFVSVNTGQIEKTGLGRVRVVVGRGGSVGIHYGKTKVESVPIDPVKFAKNRAGLIQAEFKKRRARSVSVVINGWEARGASQGSGVVESQAWMQYTNDLLDRIERDMMKADKRRTRNSVRSRMGETISLRFYYGQGVKTQSLKKFMKEHAPEPEEGTDFDEMEDADDE